MLAECRKSLGDDGMVGRIPFSIQRKQAIDPWRLDPTPCAVPILMSNDPFKAQLDGVLPRRDHAQGLHLMQQGVDQTEEALDRECPTRLGWNIEVEVFMALREKLFEP